MNIRVIVVGALMIVLALVFFFGMATMTMMPKSNDPAAMMQTVGAVSGGVGSLGVVMMIFGALRRRH